MGSTIAGLFSTKDQKEREKIVDEATKDATRIVKEYQHAWYLFVLIVIATVIGLAVYYLLGDDVPLVWKLCIYGGITGSVMSSLQRIKIDSFELEQARINVTIQAISRILIGATSGLLVMVASKSGIALSIINGNEYAATLFAFGAGFSERFIPDILKGIMSDLDVKK